MTSAPGAAGFGAVSSRLDDLLRELHGRTSEVLETVDRVQALLDTMLAIGGDLSLPVVLEKVVEGACRVLRARYGALGVVGADNRLSQFITHGIDPAGRAAIGHLPEGHGILGLLITDPRPLRLPDLTVHAGSYGFPPNHPQMRSFLGVPIRIGDTVFGNLYMCDKETAPEFSEDDEVVAVALATAAGVAINNAQLYEERRRREQWLEALGDIMRSTLSGHLVTDVLHEVARDAATISDSPSARIMVPSGHPGMLEVVAAHGPSAPAVMGALVDAGLSDAGRSFETGEVVVGDEETVDPTRLGRHGAVLNVPLLGQSSSLGVLSIVRDKHQVHYSPDDIRLVQSFATQAAVAVELGRARAERERFSLYQDRDRIARDLHDTVIQQLFGAGMRLQAVAPMSGGSEVAQRIDDVVDTIDAAIKQLRNAIFELNRRADDAYSLRSDILAVARDADQRANLRSTVSVDGPIDSAISAELGSQLLAVLREALSNVIRHAAASTIDISVVLTGDMVELAVTDDGRGLPAQVARRSGLANMESRAAELGGHCSVEEAPAGGTRVCWRVPRG